MDTTGSKTGLGQLEARAFDPHEVPLGDTYLVVKNFRVVSELAIDHRWIVHGTHVAKNGHAGSVHGHHDH